uniref:Carboxypeptidase n=1 Tax=Aegilops tauschii TaxID=37682 RepID=M8BNP6_AEGTA
MIRHTITFFLLLLLLSASPTDASQEDQLMRFIESTAKKRQADRITALPGQPPRVNFDQYAGYVTVNEEYGRELFYYFVEAPYEAATKPLILWLSGGPGCSSLGYGAMMELGPFRVNPDGKTLRRNKHAWNNLANVIFLESPTGVGFSYASNNSDNINKRGDQRTAEDTFVFLLNWLERFPEYKGRDFYIAGESYGGHYVPQLATVITFMSELHRTTFINLHGIFVGNPILDNYKNSEGNLEFLWSHGLISDEIWAGIRANCTFTPKDDGRWCSVLGQASHISGIYPRNIYDPRICLPSAREGYMAGYDPCMEYYVEAYLNTGEVQEALHARTNTNWLACPRTSGDLDSTCSITSTRYSVKDLNLPVTTPWRAWYTPDFEVGGYVQQYEGGFTFASVRGAGHLVPSYQPERALVLLYSFLKGRLPPG